MINSDLLNRAIQESGMKYKSIASSLGITYYALHNKISNKTEFKLSEMRKICNVLDISNEVQQQIFFI